MMELLVEAERYLSHGLLDHAERLFRQVADADPKSSIAAVGLARVALERGDDATAYAFGRRAVAIDPENPAAHHLVLRLEEVVRGQGGTLPTDAEIARITAAHPVATAPVPQPEVAPSQTSAQAAQPAANATPVPPLRARRPGLIGRLLGRRPRR
jgi:tetratricopeptide (TPR) repeat protein